MGIAVGRQPSKVPAMAIDSAVEEANSNRTRSVEGIPSALLGRPFPCNLRFTLESLVIAGLRDAQNAVEASVELVIR